jgi:hypothetical protein
MVFLPEELLAEILPFFNVKTIMQLKCLSKSWLAFISDPNFVEKHLKNSSQNPYLTLCCYNQRYLCFDILPYPVYRSLYLSTESYKQFLLPPGFVEVPFSLPVLRVLMDCLCFSYEFVLWQMKKFGIHESWTQLFKINYQNLQMHNIDGSFQLACLYVNGDFCK